MQQSRFLIILVGAVILSLAAWMSIFVVYPHYPVAVKRFGQIVNVEESPGLYFKVPFIDQTITVDSRLRRYDLPTQSVQVRGGAYYEVDAFFIYRISDPRLFLQRVQTGRPSFAETNNLAPRFIDALRAVYGKREFQAALSNERSDMMQEVQQQFSKDAGSLGITIVDVRIRKTDLTDAVSEDIYRQMAAERLAVAETIRARGQQDRDRIIAEANREYVEIVSAAQRDGEILRGQGQAESTRIMIEAMRVDPDFYRFWEAMDKYRQIGDVSWVMSAKEPFFDFLHNPAISAK